MSGGTTAVQQRLQEIWETPKTLCGWFSTVDLMVPVSHSLSD
jgi:hypothetical protein